MQDGWEPFLGFEVHIWEVWTVPPAAASCVGALVCQLPRPEAMGDQPGLPRGRPLSWGLFPGAALPTPRFPPPVRGKSGSSCPPKSSTPDPSCQSVPAELSVQKRHFALPSFQKRAHVMFCL